MKKYSVLTIFLIAFITSLTIKCYAAPAYPKRIPVLTQEGDTVFIVLRGDEFCKFATSNDGYTILQTDCGWYYAESDSKGNAIVSKYPLSSEYKKSKTLKHFLTKQAKGIKPQAVSCRNMKNKRVYSKNSFFVHRPAIGSRRVLVILMQFLDKQFSATPNDFNRLFNESNYNEDGAVGSVHDYYDYVSYHQLDLTSDVKGPYTTKYEMEYYGRNSFVGGYDEHPFELFEEAISQVSQDVDLADYDADGDGYIDNIHIIYAGYGEEAGASANAIWAHEMTFPEISFGGMKINRYSCASELRGNFGNGISRIGVHCHEIGHALGAMDYYDTNYEEDGIYQGTGVWDVMSSGSWNNDGICPANFNPYVKIYDYGWTVPQKMQSDSLNIIKPSFNKDHIYRLETGKSDDYFLVENRQPGLFDRGLPGNGLLIFHVGPDIQKRANDNNINSAYPQQCYIVCAGSNYKYPSSQSKSYGLINSDVCPYPGSKNNTSFTDSSIPAALTFSREETGIELTDIHLINKDIHLKCGNLDNTENPNEENDQNYIWQEDFENLVLSSFWKYENVLGNGDFEVYKKLGGADTPQSPNPFSGNGLGKFTVKSNDLFISHRTYGCLKSGKIELNSNLCYVLSMNVRKYSTNIGDCDSLYVTLNSDFNQNSQYIYPIENQNSWETLSFKIPPKTKSCTLSIQFSIENKSEIFLDGINISIGDTSCGTDADFFKPEIHDIDIYDILGRKHNKQLPGLNILKMGNGRTIKKWVK